MTGADTTAIRVHGVSGGLRSAWTAGRRVERIAYGVGAVLFASGLVHLGVLIVTGGSWIGPLSLRKPTTFGLSFGLTLATLAWATSFLAMGERIRNVLLGLFTAASVAEVFLVSMQAWRGVPSHFNFETGFDSGVSMTLAAGGGVIIVTVLGFTWAALRRAGALWPAMRLAVRFGFLSLLVALAIGAVMIANGVGDARSGDPQLAYTTAGALKPVHAVPMHAILVLPMLAWLLRFSGFTERVQLGMVRLAVAAYALLVAVVGIESFTGVPPLSAPLLETAATALAAVILLGAGGTAVYRAVRGA